MNNNMEKEDFRKILCKTYKVSIILLIFAQLESLCIMEFDLSTRMWRDRSYLGFIFLFVSFVSTQLFVFYFYRLKRWKLLLAGIWTFEVNTLSILELNMTPFTLTFLEAVAIVYGMVGLSALNGYITLRHHRGVFLKRLNLVNWSQRIFVLTGFGIIVCNEIQRPALEFPLVFLHGLMCAIMGLIYGASIWKRDFFHPNSPNDYILIGYLYYLTSYALFVCLVWGTALYSVWIVKVQE